MTGKIKKVLSVKRAPQLLNCQWNSSGIDDCQVLKYQSSVIQIYLIYHFDHEVHENTNVYGSDD